MSILYSDNYYLQYNDSQVLRVNCPKNRNPTEILNQIDNYNCNSHSWHGGLNYWLTNCQFDTQAFIKIANGIISHLEKCKDNIINYLNNHDFYWIYIDLHNDIHNSLPPGDVADVINNLNKFIAEFTQLPTSMIIINLVNNNITKNSLEGLIFKENYSNITIVDIHPEILPTDIGVQLQTGIPTNTTLTFTDYKDLLKISKPNYKAFSEHKLEDYKKIQQHIDKISDVSLFDFDKQKIDFTSNSQVFLNKTGYFINLTNDANTLLSNAIQEGYLILNYNNPSIPENAGFIGTSYDDESYHYSLHTHNESICDIYKGNISTYKHYTYNNEVNDFFESLCSNENTNHINFQPMLSDDIQSHNNDSDAYVGYVCVGALGISVTLMGLYCFTHPEHCNFFNGYKPF